MLSYKRPHFSPSPGGSRYKQQSSIKDFATNKKKDTRLFPGSRQNNRYGPLTEEDHMDEDSVSSHDTDKADNTTLGKETDS
jgi:hypothetical protein